MDRREFVRQCAQGVLALAGALYGVGRAAAEAGEPSAIDLGPFLGQRSIGRRKAPPLLHGANYDQHIRRSGPGSEYNLGGVDYAPVRFFAPTEVCPVAAGAVMGLRDDDKYGGIMLDIRHGLGWKSEYAHLQARYVGFPARVARRDVLAIRGRAGQGASRSGVMEEHLHLTVRGPVYTPLFTGIAIQERPKAVARWRYVLDPDAFSLAGTGRALPYAQPEDDALDEAFLAKHAAAVAWCDTLLDRLADADAAQAKVRERWEIQSQFDAQVDERMRFVWQRLVAGPHPFSAAEVADHRATLLDFMTTVPRFTAPIADADRQEDYRRLRPEPLKVYGQS